MNAAAAYLVLARGSARDNRTSTWSVNAIESYTGISRSRAQAAVNGLQGNGLLEAPRGGTRPQYRLRPAHEVPGCEGQLPPVLDAIEQRLFDQLMAGETLLPNRSTKAFAGKNPRLLASSLIRKGWAKDAGQGHFQPVAHDLETASKPDWIWLPNALVTGAASETPPLELVRQTQDPMTLRLLVDLYHAHNLREDGGISRTHIRQKYERLRVGQRAQFAVWGFRYRSGYVMWPALLRCHRRVELTPEEQQAGANAGVDYFRREQQLTRLGLLEWVPMLVESDGPEAEVIHPVGMGGGDSLEDQIGTAAHHAALSMLTEAQQGWAEREGLRLVPVPQHVANVQVAGTARLLYRPRTRMTAAWWADLQGRGRGYLENYLRLSGPADREAAVA